MFHDSTSSSACDRSLELGPSLGEFCNATTFVTFLTILNEFIRTKQEVSGICDRVKSVDPIDEYDFVVIGGGAGGCVVTSRLTEHSKWKVLLLESGPDEPAITGVPGLFLNLLGNSVVDWNYKTSNESYGCLSSDGSCNLTAGKMLGGSTSHNGMIYNRGNPTDYDRWADSGNTGWSYEDILPYFKKGEDNREIARVRRHYHSTGGPLPVERPRYLPQFGYSFLSAAAEAGFSISEDLNGAKYTGFSSMQTTTKDGVRHSSASAYLRPVRNRRNLHVSLSSTATKLIIEKGTATGVQYYKNGKLKTVGVRKEVILSAGTIESPKLLLLSGIGPKKHLESVGVKVVHDLPGVGENFHDHPKCYLTYSINETDTYEYNWAVAAEYLAFQTGPLTGNGIRTVLGKVATNQTTSDSPDIAIFFESYTPKCAPEQVGALRSSEPRELQFAVTNLQPKSRGRVSLASNDPFAYPVIWGNYLSDPTDIERLIQGMELGMRLAETEAMRAHNMTLKVTTVQGCSDYTYGTWDYWTCTVRQNTASDVHFAGTCKMGPDSDPMAVVDPRLRVRGIKGLRVSDASIMPQVNTVFHTTGDDDRRASCRFHQGRLELCSLVAVISSEFYINTILSRIVQKG